MWFYVYPQHHDVSFKFVALQYISLLRKYMQIETMPQLNFYLFHMPIRANAILHPFFYSMWQWDSVKWSLFKQWREHIDKLIGVDVADSDAIHKTYAGYANEYADIMVVPSKWAKQAYANSGVKINIEVVPHAYNPRLLIPTQQLKISQQIKDLQKLKRDNKLKVMLAFLWHSDYRKGADLVHQIAKKVQEERKDVILVIKTGDIRTDFNDLRTIYLSGVVPFDDIVMLYRIADVLLMPSRGGGFELNGLEALTQGIPVVAADIGPWTEYMCDEAKKYLAKTARFVPVLPGNPIHVGKGPELDVNDAVEKTLQALDRTDKVDCMDYINKRFSEPVVGETFYKVTQKVS